MGAHTLHGFLFGAGALRLHCAGERAQTMSIGEAYMATEYRIEQAGSQFTVVDPWGERLVDVFPTEEAAKQDIERCKREDAMFETAKQSGAHRHRNAYAEVWS